MKDVLFWAEVKGNLLQGAVIQTEALDVKIIISATLITIGYGFYIITKNIPYFTEHICNIHTCNGGIAGF